MILCCGEALIDMIPTGNGNAYRPLAGGSVFNTAIGLGRQGVDVGFLSGVSKDLFGTQLSDTLRESNVSTKHLIRSDRPTTLAFVKIVDGNASYAFYDENTAGRMLGPGDMPTTLDDSIEALFFGGISLAVEPCADAYLDFLKKHAQGRLVMVDPNVRPSFIEDEAAYRARLNDIFSHANIIKISEEDLNWLDPDKATIEEKVSRLLCCGPQLVCVTREAQGALLHGKDGLVASAVPPKVEVTDTVGAGDAFNAGILTGLSRRGKLSKSISRHETGSEFEEILQFATAFASDTVTRPGSDPAWNFALNAET